MNVKQLNLEQLNVAELSAVELVEITGGRDYWWDHPGILDVLFEVTPEAQRRLENAAN